MEQCCARSSSNYCGSSYCYDTKASSDYLYRLSPGDPERYQPTGAPPVPGHSTYYQQVSPTAWPQFGNGQIDGYYINDLCIGYGGPPGTNGYCDQGQTYRGKPNAACGTGNSRGRQGTWGHTDVEVWYPLPPAPAPTPPCPSGWGGDDCDIRVVTLMNGGFLTRPGIAHDDVAANSSAVVEGRASSREFIRHIVESPPAPEPLVQDDSEWGSVS